MGERPALKIEGTSITGHGYTVHIGDTDISSIVEGIEVSMHTGEPNRAEVSLVAVPIDIDLVTLVKLITEKIGP